MQWIRINSPTPERRRQYTQALLITVIGNIMLAISKSIVTYLSGSAALYADAANSISDVLYSLLMVGGLWMAQQPPDLSHPQGHSRFEPLVGLLVALAMGFAGYEAARTAIIRFLEGGIAIAPGLPTLVLLFGAALKAGMYLAIRRIAHALSSPALDATARDNLSDVLTSSAALVGTLGSTLIHPLLDPAAGVLVALWIFRAVYAVTRENLGYLTGAGASPELREILVAQIAAVPGVARVHQLLTEHVGPQLMVDVHINVDGNITLFTAHAISDQVQIALEQLNEVDRAYVHVEPLEKTL